MKSKTKVNIIVGVLFTIGIIVIVNYQNNNSFSSLIDSFEFCSINNVEKCSDIEIKELITKITLDK